jgi:hypothetical protein
MNIDTITANIKRKTIKRLRLGWFDHCSDSYDTRLVNARAYRIWLRLRGERITLRQALWGY